MSGVSNADERGARGYGVPLAGLIEKDNFLRAAQVIPFKEEK